MNKQTILFIKLIGIIGILLFRGEDFLFLKIMCIGIVILTTLLYIYTIKYFDFVAWFQDFKKTNFQKNKSNLKLRGGNKERAYVRVQNALNNGKVFVSQEEDGIYIRLAGNENEGEAFSEHKIKVYTYER